MMKRPLIALALLASMSLPALAQVTVSNAWIRATVPAQRATGGFMSLKAEQDLTLVAIETPAAGNAEIHDMKMNGTLMQMRPHGPLLLPAGQEIKLAPGGQHLMLTELKQPLKVDEQVSLTLVLEDKAKKRIKQTVQIPVKPLTQR